MKKLLIGLLLFPLLILCNITRGQLRTAISGGYHMASVPANSNPGWDTMNYNYSSRNGFHAGILVDFSFSPYSKFYLQSGMFYSNKGRNFETKYDSTGNISQVRAFQFTNYMEVPVNLVLKLKIGRKSKLIFGGGPYISWLYNGKERKDVYYSNGSVQRTENTDLKVATSQGKYINLDYGINGLFGFEMGRFFLTANYSQGFNDFYQPAGNPNGEFRHQVMGGTLGIYLTNPKRKKPQPRDRDKDGIPDKEDACPKLKGDSTARGCPDSDGDGVADKDDKCPQQAGTLKYNGCPIPDTDKDGVNDEEDKCPDVPGVARYQGCPIPDRDKDSVNDEEDKCPDVPGLVKYQGCPVPDKDQDGVPDDIDKCPTRKGPADNKGCPVIKKEIVNQVRNAAKRIQFNYNSTVLTKKSKAVLDQVVKILKSNPEIFVFIEGYVSRDGNPRNFMRLSTARAEAVRKYFLSKGIDRNRMKAEGFGAANPLNSGKTEYQRSLNRRVELKLTNYW